MSQNDLIGLLWHCLIPYLLFEEYINSMENQRWVQELRHLWNGALATINNCSQPLNTETKFYLKFEKGSKCSTVNVISIVIFPAILCLVNFNTSFKLLVIEYQLKLKIRLWKVSITWQISKYYKVPLDGFDIWYIKHVQRTL